MRCKDVVATMEVANGETLSHSIEEHLLECSSCKANWKDLQLLRVGFRALAHEPAPDPSIGFTARLARRLDETFDSHGSPAAFLERVGRRFVFASLLLAMSMLLALALPSSGPLRGSTPDGPYLIQSEASMQSEGLVPADEFGDPRDATPGNFTNGSEHQQK